MNISFIDYNKRVENAEKKIEKYKQKIEDMLNSYDVRPSSVDELEERDKNLYNRYQEVIIKTEKERDKDQVKATEMAAAGKKPISKGGKVALGLVAALVVGGAGYGIVNHFDLGKKLDTKNNTPKEDTDPLSPSQDGISQNPTDGSLSSSDVDYSDGLNTFGTNGQTSWYNNGFSIPGVNTQFPNVGTNQTPNVDDKGTSNSEVEDEPKLPSSYEEKPQVESLYETVLTDINDEEQVYARAKYIKEKYYDVYLKDRYVTIEYVEEQLRQINAGICESVSFESANNTIVVINDLVFREEGNATDRVNQVTNTREETSGTLDLGIFCVDGTKGQMLLHQLSEIRTGMIQGAGKTDISDLQKDYTELFLRSTLLQGYEAIDINSLETGGMKYLAGISFLNTATLCGDFREVIIEDPLTLEKISLQSVIDQFNNAECQTNVVDENGQKTDEVETLNYLGTYFFEMVSDNYTKKSMYDEDFGKVLK